MKLGIRTPSPTKTVKARTTGRLKRAVKGSYNPFYGKKGMGYLKDPERAVKNKIYHKVTVDPLESAKHSESDTFEKKATSQPTVLMIFLCTIYFFALVYTFLILFLNHEVNYGGLGVAITCAAIVIILDKATS